MSRAGEQEAIDDLYEAIKNGSDDPLRLIPLSTPVIQCESLIRAANALESIAGSLEKMAKRPTYVVNHDGTITKTDVDGTEDTL